MTKTLKTDYLVIGSGAMGLAFIDTLLSESDANIVVVDRFAKPGGHWNSAYPFVTLHQPSAFYGVNSKRLEQGRIDQTGLNKGLADLATGAEILAYFEDVMRGFVETGRVRYFPLCNYTGKGRFAHKLSDQDWQVEYGKLVDCTLLNTSVPSTHTPNFKVDGGVRFMSLNDLPKITDQPTGYTVVGGGKTGIDAVLWLLENHVPAKRIRWIKSRDGWLLNRKNTQAAPEFFTDTIGNQANLYQSIAEATSKSDMFARLESCGYFLRLDPNIQPSMFHGATISEAELAALRTVRDVVRRGRVAAITPEFITFANGASEPTLDHVIVDCSASAIKDYIAKPVFENDVIRPQTVRAYQPVFSGAFVAYIEARGEREGWDITKRNSYCGVVPLPDDLDTFVRMTAANMMNQALWGQGKLQAFMR